MRVALAVVAAGVIAAGSAVVLGEYNFAGTTPWVAAVVVPLATAEGCALVAGRRPAWLWPMAAVVGAAGLAWGVWLSAGRGLDPWPAGGTEAVAAGAVWPLLIGALAWRRRRQAGAARVS